MRVELVRTDNNGDVFNKRYVDFFATNADSLLIEGSKQPFVRIAGENRYLKSEIHDWFDSLNADYSIYSLYSAKSGSIPYSLELLWALDIPDENVALLFKLTWF